MGIVVGVDEAGRGPTLGPLVVAGAAIDEKDLDKLRKIGVKDSKLLTPKRREEMFDQIKEALQDYKIIITQPKEIDAAIFSETSNLNILETEKFAMAINYLKPSRVIIDCPSVNTVKYKEHIRTYLKGKINIVCEHKADTKYEIVAAASILAKVIRDREIEELKKRYGVDFGSGYPADPKTKEFLANNWKKYPDLFRKSWASYKNVAGEKSQSKLEDF